MLAFLAVIPVASATAPIVSSQITTKSNNIHYVNENIYLDNKKNESQNLSKNQDSFSVNGDNYQTTHRVYIHSDSDKYLPEQENTVDDIIGKGKKDTWYDQSFSGLSLDITKYAANKTEFLNKYKLVNITYSYMYNFWNGVQHWTSPYQKNPTVLMWNYNYNLRENDEIIEILQSTDKSHKSNEKARLILETSWNSNILNLNWKLGVWYHWATGSIYDHAAFTSFTNDCYSFLKSSNSSISNVESKIDNFSKPSVITLPSKDKVSSLNNIDSELKKISKQKEIKNSFFTSAFEVIQYYTGKKTVIISGDIWFFKVSMIVRWDSFSHVVLDSNLIVNSTGIECSRWFEIESIGNFCRMVYKNNVGVEDYTNYQIFDPKFSGIKLTGAIALSYIYYA